MTTSNQSLTLPLQSTDAPWVEKYRPATLEDVKGQDRVIHLFQQMLLNNKPMHFLFYGPPGTGKTSTILSLCKELYLNRPREQYVLEINASYDRGIDMVRQKIKPFCKRSTTAFQTSSGQHTVNYKFVILDEADTLTNDAQNALRRCIEIYSYNTRFCFLCNYVSNIIPPILSRCYACHFKPVAKANALALMQSICEKESVQHTPEMLSTVYDAFRGDLRGCLTTLQAVYHMYGKVTIEFIHEQMGAVDKNVWSKILGLPDIMAVHQLVNTLYQSGTSVRKLLLSLVEWSLTSCSPEEIETLGPLVSRMERQCLFQHDSRILLLELVYTVWLFSKKQTTTCHNYSIDKIL